jgi:hypothetical protein
MLNIINYCYLVDAQRFTLLRVKATSEDTSTSSDELIADLKAKVLVYLYQFQKIKCFSIIPRLTQLIDFFSGMQLRINQLCFCMEVAQLSQSGCLRL